MHSKEVLVRSAQLPRWKGVIINDLPLDLVVNEEYKEGKVKLTLVTSFCCSFTGEQEQ